MFKHKKIIYLICGILFLFAIVANATEGDNQKESSDIKIEAPVGRLGRPLEPADIAYINRKAEEKYERRNAEITPLVLDGTPPNPGNAALQYYQALLRFPEPNAVVSMKFRECSVTNEPDREVKIYMSQCLEAIEIVEKASRMTGCIWNALPERGTGIGALHLKLGRLQEILQVDAKILAAEGHYRMALERCLTLLRLAEHLSEDPELSYGFTNFNADIMAQNTVRDILGVMPPDADILTWLRGRLAAVQGTPPSFNKWLQEDIRSVLRHIPTDPFNRLARLRNMLIESANDEKVKEEIRNLTDEQLISRAGKGFHRVIDQILRIVDSEMTFEQKRAEIHRFFNKPNETEVIEPATKAIMKMYIMNLDGQIDAMYTAQVSRQAHKNGIKAAVEIYLILAKTGKLPEKLPDYLPKDPFTRRDIVYETTNDGFALHCQLDDQRKKEQLLRWLTFKVQK